MKSYSWTGPGSFTSTDREITVTVAGIYEVTITNSDDCSSKCSRELTVESCATAICTYTQGYYGNVGGKSCASDLGGNFGQYTTIELIQRALSSYPGGVMTIGSSRNTVLIANTLQDRMAIIAALPGVEVVMNYQVAHQ